MSVGASTPTMEIPSLIIEGRQERVRLQPMEGSGKWTLDRSLEVVDGGIGRKSELKNVQGKIALLKRGTLTFTEKANNALEAGAKAVLIYNNMSGNFMGNLDTQLTLPVGSLSRSDGVILQKELKKRSVTVRVLVNEERDRLADFSSRGPVTGTWEIKPDIVAPGVAINSTIPGGYLSLQGTSMAAPHVAGACALIKQAHPDWSPAQIKAALMNTAKPLARQGESVNMDRAATGSPYYRTYEQGAGRIQVDEAIMAASLVTPSSIRFGKFAGENDSHKARLRVENTSKNVQRYAFVIPKKVEGLAWRFPLSFTLEPGQSREVAVELMVDQSVFKGKIHDGFLQLQAGAKTIQIPYLYVLEEPGYPRVMGFGFAEGDRPGEYRYEVYLPGGAEEFGIALFNPEDYRFVGFLDTITNVKKGQIHRNLTTEMLPAAGTYLVKIFAKKAGKEDFIERMIVIKEKGE
ncbi:S8 family serine peptidase [Neobacillus sp. OS1-2]|uniref:S8 family serine peptidase n=1 Tax=Neobacillus sp. OS1-2 TaxID=3070680 RepID=UPI0035A7214C